jgi:hypothetical protein
MSAILSRLHEEHMQKKIIQRIEAEIGCHHLFENLVEKCSFPDLTSLLLNVYREKAKKVTPRLLLQQYTNNRFVQPAKANVCAAMKFDLFARALLPKDFEMIELSPLAPLGANSVIASVDQNNALSTIRNVEVCSDPTNVLALESAARKQRLKKEGVDQSKIKLCTSQRVVRCQKFEGAAFFSHFRLLALTTAGFDEGLFIFETEALFEHISFFIHLLHKSRELGIKVRDLSVHVTALDESRLDVLQQKVLNRLAEHDHVIVEFDQKRETGRGYYCDACYHISAKDAAGNDLLLVDGGFTNWTRQLLSNQKERFLISGLGSERLLVCT